MKGGRRRKEEETNHDVLRIDDSLDLAEQLYGTRTELGFDVVLRERQS